jgi:hypothetical protein
MDLVVSFSPLVFKNNRMPREILDIILSFVWQSRHDDCWARCEEKSEREDGLAAVDEECNWADT